MNPFLRALVAAGLLDQATADRMNRALSPEQAQAYAEQQMAALWAGGLQGQLARLLDAIRANDYGFPPAVMEGFWRRENRLLYESVIPGLRDVAQEAAITAAVRGGGFSMWNAVNERVIDWVEDYYISADTALVGSIPNLNLTGRTIVGNAFNAWQRGELEAATNEEGLPRLIAALEPAFGPERASRISITETTRIMSTSERAAGDADPNTVAYRFLASADDRVCPQCGPLHGRLVAKGEAGGFVHPTLGRIGFPPLHPGCRCTLAREGSETVPVDIGAGGAGVWHYSGPPAVPSDRGRRGN